jgi:Cu(I)/Ag(I) efflux system protein CusF
MIKSTSLVVATFFAVSTAWASGSGHGHGHAAAPAAPKDAAQAANASMTDAEVRKVDKENKKITLKHGEIKNLGMPGMTMVFQVKDASVLDKVKAGDKVRFTAEKTSDGAFAVTNLETAK